MTSAVFYTVLFSGFFLTMLLAIIQPVRGWWGSLRTKSSWSVLIILAFAATLLGGMSAMTSELQDVGLPRILRAIVLITLFLLVVRRAISGVTSMRYAGTAAFVMVVFALYCMLSMMYSSSPIMTLWKGFEVLTLTLVGVSISGELRKMQDLRHLLNILSLILLFMVSTFIIGIIVFPGEAFTKMEMSSSIVVRGLGPRMNANSVTQLSALLAVFALPVALNSGKLKARGAWILFGVAATVMLLGHSRTSIFAFILAVTAILFFGRHRLLALFVTIGGASAFLLTEVVMLYIYRGQSKEVFTSLTGRTDWWAMAMESVAESPWFGHGYYAAQRELYSTSTLDNTYIDVMLGLGIIGVAIFVIPIILTAFRLFVTRPAKTDSVTSQVIWLQLMVLFGLLFVRSLTGPSFQVLHHNLVMYSLLLVGVAAYARLKNIITESEAPEGKPEFRQPPPRILRPKTMSHRIAEK